MTRTILLPALIGSVYLLCGVSLSGCSKRQLNPVEVLPTVAAPVSSMRETATPIEVEIKSAAIEDGELRVTAVVLAKGELPAEKVALTLKGLGVGEVLREKTVTLREVFPVERFLPGQRVLFDLKIDATALTEYQLVSAWGDEVNNTPPAVAVSSPALQVIERKEITTSCKDCGRNLAIELTVVNSGTLPIRGVTIATALYFEDGVLSVSPTADFLPATGSETVSELAELTFEPGEKKKIVVRIDREIPKVDGGRFRPWVRLVSSRIAVQTP